MFISFMVCIWFVLYFHFANIQIYFVSMQMNHDFLCLFLPYLYVLSKNQAKQSQW